MSFLQNFNALVYIIYQHVVLRKGFELALEQKDKSAARELKSPIESLQD